jgi:hypothetical protein
LRAATLPARDENCKPKRVVRDRGGMIGAGVR